MANPTTNTTVIPLIPLCSSLLHATELREGETPLGRPERGAVRDVARVGQRRRAGVGRWGVGTGDGIVASGIGGLSKGGACCGAAQTPFPAAKAPLGQGGARHGAACSSWPAGATAPRCGGARHGAAWPFCCAGAATPRWGRMCRAARPSWPA